MVLQLVAVIVLVVVVVGAVTVAAAVVRPGSRHWLHIMLEHLF